MLDNLEPRSHGGAWPHPEGDQRGRDPRFVSLIKEILLQHSMTAFVIFI